jgi:hypothetical protein
MKHTRLILKITLPCLALAFVSGCRSVSKETGSDREDKVIMNLSSEERIENNSEVFFILSNQTIIRAQKTMPQGFYVKGSMEGGKFIAKSDVLGVGNLATSGRYGWLELQSKSFFPMESDRKALAPFVKGYQNAAGDFVPSEREVINIP